MVAPWLVRFVRAGSPECIWAQARALRALLAPSIETLLPLAKAAGVADLVHRAGHLWAYRTEESFRKDSAAWQLRRDNGIVVTELDADQLRQTEPALSREFTRGILVEENGHLGNPLRMVQGLAQELRRNGGEIHVARATGFTLEGGRLKAIRTDRGEFPCDVAVVAAGAWSKPLAAELGDRVPLETERGYHIMIRDPEAMPRLPVADGDGKFASTPMETGLRFAGTVELAGLHAPPDWRRARILLEQGRRLFPGLKASYPEERLSHWMGHRPSMPDSLPCLGASTRSPDVIYAFGHGHVGMAASPVTGKVVADLVTGRAPSIDIAPFRAGRFA
jgi:D-amino-acid dehydrogenase